MSYFNEYRIPSKADFNFEMAPTGGQVIVTAAASNLLVGVEMTEVTAGDTELESACDSLEASVSLGVGALYVAQAVVVDSAFLVSVSELGASDWKLGALRALDLDRYVFEWQSPEYVIESMSV